MAHHNQDDQGSNPEIILELLLSRHVQPLVPIPNGYDTAYHCPNFTLILKAFVTVLSVNKMWTEMIELEEIVFTNFDLYSLVLI